MLKDGFMGHDGTPSLRMRRRKLLGACAKKFGLADHPQRNCAFIKYD
jgi:hypothetical protein